MYALAYSEGRRGKAQTSKDVLYHFLSVVFLPRISPQPIISQVLRPCILNCEFPEDVTNHFQGFKNFMDHVYCSFKTYIDSLFIYKASIILFVPSVIYLFLFLQFKLDFK